VVAFSVGVQSVGRELAKEQGERGPKRIDQRPETADPQAATSGAAAETRERRRLRGGRGDERQRRAGADEFEPVEELFERRDTQRRRERYGRTAAGQVVEIAQVAAVRAVETRGGGLGAAQRGRRTGRRAEKGAGQEQGVRGQRRRRRRRR